LPLRAACKELLARLVPDTTERLAAQDRAHLEAVQGVLGQQLESLPLPELSQCAKICTSIAEPRPATFAKMFSTEGETFVFPRLLRR
ncbi:unnamed protein product, partial [Chrysoparadoxa australica]